MSPVTTRRPNAEEEEEILDDESEGFDDDAEESTPAAPAVSDSRRRRQAKRGIVDTAEDATTAVEPSRKDRPTPSQREEAPTRRNAVAQFVYNVREYFHEVTVELRKVAWPTRTEVQRLTYIVLAVTIASALFLGLVSFLFGTLTQSMATSDNVAFPAIVSIALIIIVAGGWLMKDRLFGTGEQE